MLKFHLGDGRSLSHWGGIEKSSFGKLFNTGHPGWISHERSFSLCCTKSLKCEAACYGSYSTLV